MSKNLHSKITFVLAIALSLLVAGGCMKVKDEDRFRTINVPPEKLKQIDTLDLNAMEDKQPKPSEPNEAPPELALSLERVRAITLQYNLDLKVELLNPTIAAEDLNFAEARKYEVVLSSGVTFSKTDSPPRDVHLSGSQRQDINKNFGVSIPLQTGGKIDFSLGDYHSETNLAYTDYPDSFSTPFVLSVSQPLLKGAGKREFMHSIRVARYNEQIVNATTKMEIIRYISDADKAYWDLYKKRRVLEVRQQQYALAEAQLERARRFVDAGQNPQVDLIRAEAGLAGQLSTIIAAENNLRMSQRDLKKILNKPGLSMETPTVIIPATDPDPMHHLLDRDKLVTYAIENRMDMLQLEFDIAKNLSEIEHLRNASLPDLSLRYRYGIGALGRSRIESYEMLRDKKFEDHSVSLNLLYPLGNRVARSDLRRALYSRRRQLATRAGRKTLIEQNVLNALDGLETSWQNILANRQSAILDGRLYQAEQRQFEVGVRTSTDVLEAQARFANSQSAEYEALANYQIALVTLAEATGTLLGAAKIEWEPDVPDIGIKPMKRK